MTWECPTCERAYPDNGIEIKDAERESYCFVCAVHPGELQELVEEWRDKADSAPHEMCVEKMYGYAADDLEAVLEP